MLTGNTAKWESSTDFVFHTELYVDGKLVESPRLPASYATRRYELAWKYKLSPGKHTVELRVLNPSDRESITHVEAIYYSDKPIDGMKENQADAAAMN